MGQLGCRRALGDVPQAQRHYLKRSRSCTRTSRDDVVYANFADLLIKLGFFNGVRSRVEAAERNPQGAKPLSRGEGPRTARTQRYQPALVRAAIALDPTIPSPISALAGVPPAWPTRMPTARDSVHGAQARAGRTALVRSCRSRSLLPRGAAPRHISDVHRVTRHPASPSASRLEDGCEFLPETMGAASRSSRRRRRTPDCLYQRREDHRRHDVGPAADKPDPRSGIVSIASRGWKFADITAVGCGRYTL